MRGMGLTRTVIVGSQKLLEDSFNFTYDRVKKRHFIYDVQHVRIMAAARTTESVGRLMRLDRILSTINEGILSTRRRRGVRITYIVGRPIDSVSSDDRVQVSAWHRTSGRLPTMLCDERRGSVHLAGLIERSEGEIWGTTELRTHISGSVIASVGSADRTSVKMHRLLRTGHTNGR